MSCVEVGGGGWSWVHGLVILFLKNILVCLVCFLVCFSIFR